MADLLIFT